MYGRVPSKPTPKFKFNGMVCSSRYHGTFDKVYFPYWSEECFRITIIENIVPPVYKLNEYERRGFNGYVLWARAAENFDWPQRIVYNWKGSWKKGRLVLVRFVGWPNKFNMWVSDKDILHLKKEKTILIFHKKTDCTTLST